VRQALAQQVFVQMASVMREFARKPA